KGSSFSVKYKGLCLNLFLSLVGEHYIQNAVTALKVLEVLDRNFSVNIKLDSIKKGFSSALIPGRFQIVGGHPKLVLDGAHNASSALMLRNTVKEVFRDKKIVLVLGISSDKDIKKIGEVLCPVAESVIFTKSSSSRAAEPRALVNKLKAFCKQYYVCDSPEDAIVFAKNMVGRDGVVVATGSFYLVADVMKNNGLWRA
ncbi:MAG: cyanophycin synthetase, partial [Candidatus Omnitrophota bacterium]